MLYLMLSSLSITPAAINWWNAALALLILIAGKFVAVLLRKLVTLLIRLLGTDVMVRRLRGRSLREGESITGRPSHLIGSLVYWLSLVAALTLSLQHLGLENASRLITDMIPWLPSLLIFAGLSVLAIHLISFAGDWAEDAFRTFGMPLAGLFGLLLRLALWALLIVIAIEELGWGGSATTRVILLILSTIPVAAVLAFGLGGRQAAGNILAAGFLRSQLRPGTFIQSDSHHGMVLKVGWTHTLIRTEEGTLYIPNRKLSDHNLRKLDPVSADHPLPPTETDR